MSTSAPDREPPDAPRPPDRERASTSDYGRYAALGIQLAATPLLLGALGHWLDKKLATEPWLLLVGIFVGAAGGFYSIARQVYGTKPKKPKTNGRR